MLEQVKEFSDEKIVDYKKISENSNLLNDPAKWRELFDDYKNSLVHSTYQSGIEFHYKKALCENFVSEVQQTFPTRLWIYESNTDKILKNEEDFTNTMIDSYLKLVDPWDSEDEFQKFNNLSKVTDDFLKYLKKDELSGKSTRSLQSEPQKMQDSHLLHKIRADHSPHKLLALNDKHKDETSLLDKIYNGKTLIHSS